MISLLAPGSGERSSGNTIPLHLVDRIVETYRPTVFIETGTYLGFTVERVHTQFEEVYTIELDVALATQACTKFAATSSVHVMQGDARDCLPRVLEAIGQHRALVWLDAHWSDGVTARRSVTEHTSVRDELNALRDCKARRDHILMVDDLSYFTGCDGYPTIDELVQKVKEINVAYVIERLELRNGVLIALPPLP